MGHSLALVDLLTSATVVAHIYNVRSVSFWKLDCVKNSHPPVVRYHYYPVVCGLPTFAGLGTGGVGVINPYRPFSHVLYTLRSSWASNNVPPVRHPTAYACKRGLEIWNSGFQPVNKDWNSLIWYIYIYKKKHTTIQGWCKCAFAFVLITCLSLVLVFGLGRIPKLRGPFGNSGKLVKLIFVSGARAVERLGNAHLYFST